MKFLGILSILACLAYHPVSASSAVVACDATTGSSIKVVGIRTTKTTANIYWSEGRHNGGRVITYGINSFGPTAYVQSRAANVKVERLVGLTPNSKYKYRFYGLWGKKDANKMDTFRKDSLSGTFNTDSSGCGDIVSLSVEVSGIALSSSGDSLENVQVTITKTTDGKVYGTDLTDRSGGFSFAVDPGSYTIKFVYPPYTSPTPYPITLVSGSARQIPNQILTGTFFQLGGTVLAADKVTAIELATVKITSKTDTTVSYTRTTDSDGHFNVGLKPGDYLVNATFGGKTLASPMSVNVAGSKEMPDLVLAVTVGIHASPKWANPANSTARGYNANGVIRSARSTNHVHVFKAIK